MRHVLNVIIFVSVFAFDVLSWCVHLCTQCLKGVPVKKKTLRFSIGVSIGLVRININKKGKEEKYNFW